MDLSRNIIKRYVAVSTPEKVTSNSDTRYGTVVSQGEDTFVMIDGSSILTPVTSNVSLKDGDRVLVLVKNHEATVLGSPTAPTARLEELRALEEGVTEFEVILADKVGTGELVAMQALIEDLEAKDVEISGTLQAATASIETLTAENATINGKLDVYQADIEELQADSAKIEKIEADNVKINNTLTAQAASISNLQADVADVDTLIFGSASGTTIQTSFSNAVIAQLGNAQIKSAMIDSLSADKIMAGDILTNNVRVLSEDGKLLISDETIQISDDTRVRVQIGKDESNDYSINIWDADGKLMFSQGGITDAAIKDAIIRNDMVANDANIAASKLDISSLFTEINNSTETINSNRVLIDTAAGTLDVAFTQMSSDLDDISDEVTSQGTALSVVQNQINSKVWMEDIGNVDLSEIEGSISTLETQYSELNQTVGGISATVAEHTTQIQNKADSSDVTSVSEKVTEVEADLDGFRTSVSSTYVTKTDLGDNYYTKTETDSQINVSGEGILSTVSSTYTDNETTANILGDIESILGDGTEENAGLISSLSSQINQTDGALRVEIQKTVENISTVDGKIDQVQATVNKYSTWFDMDDNGMTIGKMADGEELPLKVKLDNDSLDFLDNDTVVAYVSNEKLMINAAEVQGSLDVGGFRWVARKNGNMGLMWIGG